MMALAFEDFEESTQAQPAATGDDAVPKAVVEAERMAAYEQGYKAGWDDAARAEAEDQTRIGADFARNLQDLSFTFHEARAHVLQSMEPLLEELIDTLLPDLVGETLGLRIVEELRPMIEDGADSPIELVVAPQSRAALEKQLADTNTSAIRLSEEPSLAEGQAYLRVGKTERQIDMTGALERISVAIQSLYALNERTLKHA